MIPKTEFFEWIEDYCLEQLNETNRIKFEKELSKNTELREEVKFQKEILSAIKETDITELRDKLENIAKSGQKNGSFELLDEFADIQDITDAISPEDLINFYDSLPKVHVYQHERTTNENIHQYYKDQNEFAENKEEGELSDLDDFNDLEGLEEAILEKDIFNLRDTLAQVAKTVEPQFSAEDIDKYINGELTGQKREQFEAEMAQNRALQEEVELHLEMETAIQENDILELRNRITQIMETETSWNVSEHNIEDYIDGELEGELLEEFMAELNENTDLMAEVKMRSDVNEAIGEKDIFSLRDELKTARKSAENTEIKSIVPNTTVKLISAWKRGAAVIILLLGIAGFLNVGVNSVDELYHSSYQAPSWSPERSVASSENQNYIKEANIYYSQENYEKALPLYDLGLKNVDEKDKFVFHFYKAASLQNMELFSKAIPEYKMVIKQGENYFIEEAEWNMTLCYLKLGKRNIAKNQLQAIINKNGYYKNEAKATLRRLKYSFR